MAIKLAATLLLAVATRVSNKSVNDKDSEYNVDSRDPNLGYYFIAFAWTLLLLSLLWCCIIADGTIGLELTRKASRSNQKKLSKRARRR